MMKALKFDLEVPFWCSFGDFSSLNIKLSYPFPPLTTLFGLIQNSLGKPAPHIINEKSHYNSTIENYVENFNHLSFSIIIREAGEKIEDFVNIHKGNRKDGYERDFGPKLNNYINSSDETSHLKDFIEENCENLSFNSILNKIKTYQFYLFVSDKEFDSRHEETFDEIYKILDDSNCLHIIDEVKRYWNNKNIQYGYWKPWLSTQIIRQRLINPYFSIYVLSDIDTGEFSLENIKKALEDPKRPLYIGESDDVVNILGISIVDIEENVSNNISSILPGIYSNCELIKIPSNLKFDTENEFYTLCSIPNGDLDQEVECYSYDGENFVFL